MLSEQVQYQDKAGFFKLNFEKWYFSKYWQVQTRQVFAQTITYMMSFMYVGLPAPSNVAATALSHSSVKVTWDHLSDATEYIISYTTTALHISNGNVTVKDGSTTSHTLTNLVANTFYDITAQATTSDGRKSALSSKVSIRTPAAGKSYP